MIVNPVAAAATCSIAALIMVGILAFRKIRRKRRTLETVKQVLKNVSMARDDHVSTKGVVNKC